MIDDNTLAQTIKWQTRPLCCQYRLVHFEAQTIAVCAQGATRDQIAHWGLGVLADGQCEVLGVWLYPASGMKGWHQLFEDLKVRGVEKIRFVASNERMDVSAAMRTAYPDTTVLPVTRQLLRQSLTQVAPRQRNSGAQVLEGLCAAASAQAAGALLTALEASPWGKSNPVVVEQWRMAVEQLEPLHALVPRLRRLVHSGGGVALRVAETLQRACARKGCFPTETAAIAFVSQVLDRMNRDFGAAGSAVGGVVLGFVRRPGKGSVLAGCN